MDKDKVLSAFRRYRRACRSEGSVDWGDEVLMQYDNDRCFLWHVSFDFASNVADESLFLKCLDEEMCK